MSLIFSCLSNIEHQAWEILMKKEGKRRRKECRRKREKGEGEGGRKGAKRKRSSSEFHTPQKKVTLKNFSI